MKGFLWFLAGVAAFIAFCIFGAYQGWGDGAQSAAPKHKYKLASGKIIECAGKGSGYCGEFFYNCADGREYQCQTNVEPQ